MRKFLLGVYLWFLGVNLCDHPCSSLRYCPKCEDMKSDTRLSAYVARQKYLKNLRDSWRSL